MKNPFRMIYDLADRFTEQVFPKVLEKAGLSKDMALSASELGGGVTGIVSIITGTILGAAALSTLAVPAAILSTLVFGGLSATMIVGGLGLGKSVFAEFRRSFLGPTGGVPEAAPVVSAPPASAPAFDPGVTPAADFRQAVEPKAAEPASPASAVVPAVAPKPAA